MAKRKAHFAAVYLTTILITLVLMGGTAFVVYKQYVEKPKSVGVDSASGSELLFKPDENHSQTLLLILNGGDTQPDDVFVLSRFLPVEEKVILIPLSGKTYSQINTTKSTLYEFYRTGGAAKAVEAVENALNIQVEKYIQFDKTSFNTLADILGGVNYTLPRTLVYDNTATGESIILREGRQLLDGTKLRWLMTFPEFEEGEEYRVQVIGSVLTDLLNGALSERLANTLDGSFNTIINTVETNITAYDYQFRKDAISYLIQPGTTPVQFKLPTGTWDEEDRYVLGSSFREDVLYWFKVDPLIEMD